MHACRLHSCRHRCSAAANHSCPAARCIASAQAGAVDPAELAMYAALMTSNTNVQMVEYLMAGAAHMHWQHNA